MALPAWLAMMVQVPALMPLTVLPLTEQTAGVAELKLAARPEVAVALTVVMPPTAKEAGVKLMAPMVWLALPAVTLLLTCDAGR